jgi:hypothetical protein
MDGRSDSDIPAFRMHTTTLNTGHTYGTIIDTMDIIKQGEKDKHLKRLEKIPHS